jgi:hypothetical protein
MKRNIGAKVSFEDLNENTTRKTSTLISGSRNIKAFYVIEQRAKNSIGLSSFFVFGTRAEIGARPPHC